MNFNEDSDSYTKGRNPSRLSSLLLLMGIIDGVIDMTKEERRISTKNNKLAWEHFWPEGEGKAKEGYHLHHVDESLRDSDVERYIEWNVEDLVMVTMEEHNSIHKKGNHYHLGKKHSVETKQKIGDANKGRLLGIPKSEEHKRKISASRKGKTAGENNWRYGTHLSDKEKENLSLLNSGEKNPFFGKHHSDKTLNALKSKRWWNNGKVNVFQEVCPEGFVNGMLKHRVVRS